MSTSLPFPKNGDIILKSTTKPRAKSDSHILSKPELYEWYEDIIVFRVFIFILLFRTYGKERNFRMTEASVTVIIALLKVLFWKLHDQCYVQSSFSTIVSQSANSIDKGMQRFYRYESTYVLILSLRREWVKTSRNEKLWRCLDIAIWTKNPCLYLKEHCTNIDNISPIFIRFFFAQANFLFKFNLLLIGMHMGKFSSHFFYLFTFW